MVLLGLFAFFRFTPLGLAMRAAAQNPDSARLVGIRVSWMLALGWGLAAAIGAVAGMMVAPIVFLDPNMMAGILLYGFAAALLGGIDNPLGAVIGGFIVGVLENLLGAYVIGTELKLTVALVLIVATLTLAARRPVRQEGRGARMNQTADRKWVWIGSVLLVVALLVLPFLVKNYRVFQFNLVLVYAIAMLGPEHPDRLQRPDLARPRRLLRLRRLHRGDPDGRCTTCPTGRRCRAAFVFCFVFGFLFGFPALRLAGPLPGAGHLRAGAGRAADAEVQEDRGPDRRRAGHRAEQAGAAVQLPPVRPAAVSADHWLYFFTLFVAALMFLFAWNLLRGRVGRALVAIRDHPIAATAMGINLPLFKSLTFGISAGFTGVAGALGAIVVAFVSPDSFTVVLSIFLLVGVVVGGLASIPGAIFGGIFIQFVPNIADEISKSAPGRHLRRAADRPDVPDAHRRDGRPAPCLVTAARQGRQLTGFQSVANLDRPKETLHR